jgi:hypothetical protein
VVESFWSGAIFMPNPIMNAKSVSRRRFLGGMAAVAAMYELQPELSLRAQTRPTPDDPIERSRLPADQYEAVAKLCFNENPFGPPPSVIEAMTHAFKYVNRYGCPGHRCASRCRAGEHFAGSRLNRDSRSI